MSEEKQRRNKRSNDSETTRDQWSENGNSQSENGNMIDENTEENKKRRKDIEDMNEVVTEENDEVQPDDKDYETEEIIDVDQKQENEVQDTKLENCEIDVADKKKRLRKSKKADSGATHSRSKDFEDETLRRRMKKARKNSKRGSKKRGLKKPKGTKKEVRIQEYGGEYEVEKILQVKILGNGKSEFLIRWKGFPAEYDTWEPEANLDCEDLIKEYFDENGKVFFANCMAEREMCELVGRSSTRTRRNSSRKRLLSRKRRSEGKAKGASKSNLSGQALSDSDLSSEENEKEAKKRLRVTRQSRRKRDGRSSMKRRMLRIRELRNKRKKEDETDEEDSSVEKLEQGDYKKSAKDQNKENLAFSSESDEAKESDDSEVGGDDMEYEVEKIVDVRYLKNGSREFLIKWRGFSIKENSWEPESCLNCSAKLEAFLKGIEEKSTERQLRFDRKKTDRFTLHSQAHQRKLSSRLEKLPRKSYSEID